MYLNHNEDEVVIRTKQGKEIMVSFDSIIKCADTEYQKQLIHEASDILFTSLGREKGEKKFRFYQSKLFKAHNGISIEDAKKKAKEKGASCSSGRDAIRFLNPVIASAMAFSDYLVMNGIDVDEAIEISKEMAPIFEEINNFNLAS